MHSGGLRRNARGRNLDTSHVSFPEPEADFYQTVGTKQRAVLTGQTHSTTLTRSSFVLSVLAHFTASSLRSV